MYVYFWYTCTVTKARYVSCIMTFILSEIWWISIVTLNEVAGCQGDPYSWKVLALLSARYLFLFFLSFFFSSLSPYLPSFSSFLPLLPPFAPSFLLSFFSSLPFFLPSLPIPPPFFILPSHIANFIISLDMKTLENVFVLAKIFTSVFSCLLVYRLYLELVCLFQLKKWEILLGQGISPLF